MFDALLITLALAGSAPAAAQAATSPETVVQRQLDAYNRHDEAAFVATYAQDIEIFDLGAEPKPRLTGKPALSALYAGLFARAKPRADIVSRAVTGAFVTDHERVTLASGRSFDAVAVYQVENGLIRRVWFAQ
ncbi:nuclear transport factor 2 family protein [Sphingomonas colocasiae]|uniref:Nuclear transport factor 2 family protein n=1 Tax=Sphingomonas colocasiae TaxID=1848973 RepID=A0ABS7Q151_9SPHN|nr:nuclear transport factor 2 family protein [Sphingomonas colocasiae]MBY8826262.1 nuclear transport factor 2 family protein [Sphingomonas colocasiae]